MSTESGRYLDPHTLASVGAIDLRARMIVEGLMTGMHRSPMQGFSVEFAQHRQYAPGDDTRFLDWKVYGKTDKLYLKQFHQETNLDLLLLVDVSGSMAYGSVRSKDEPRRLWRKFDHAASLAAAMAYLALKQQDRVGLILFADELRLATRLSNASDHWRTIVEALAGASPESAEALAEAANPRRARHEPPTPRRDLAALFDRVVARLTQRSLLVLISDLFEEPAAIERGLARLRHGRHDLIILQTIDPAELEFPFRSGSEFVGLEGEGRLPADPAALRRMYLDALREHLTAVEQLARRFHFDHLLLDSSASLGPPLSQFLARRAAGITRGRAVSVARGS